MPTPVLQTKTYVEHPETGLLADAYLLLVKSQGYLLRKA